MIPQSPAWSAWGSPWACLPVTHHQCRPLPQVLCPVQPALTLSSMADGSSPGKQGLIPLTHGDVPGSAKQEVDEDRVEGAVEAEHRRQSSQERVGQACGGVVRMQTGG